MHFFFFAVFQFLTFKSVKQLLVMSNSSAALASEKVFFASLLVSIHMVLFICSIRLGEMEHASVKHCLQLSYLK